MVEFLEERIETWVYWMREREAIRQKRAAGKPPPWTNDPVFLTTRFTNVCRMDDKVSEWLMRDFYPHYRSAYAQPYAAVVLATVARLINWPPTLELITLNNTTGDYVDAVARALRKCAASGGKVFTGAYIINGKKGQSKVETVIEQVRHVYKDRYSLVDTTSIENTWARLMTVPGIGSFIAGQISADLRHVVPGTWDDALQFAPRGPGSLRGLAWLRGNHVANMPQERFNTNLMLLIALARRRIPKIFEDRRLEAMDIQNTLCELSKYVRIKYNGGRAKNKVSYT